MESPPEMAGRDGKSPISMVDVQLPVVAKVEAQAGPSVLASSSTPLGPGRQT